MWNTREGNGSCCRWRLECRVFLNEPSWDQHMWKGGKDERLGRGRRWAARQSKKISTDPMENSGAEWLLRVVLSWGKTGMLWNLCSLILDIDEDHFPAALLAAEELRFSVLEEKLGGTSQHPHKKKKNRSSRGQQTLVNILGLQASLLQLLVSAVVAWKQPQAMCK